MRKGRFKLLEWAFGFKCAYCGGGVGTPLTADHVIPIAKGGYKGALNCVPACEKCNGLKGNMDLHAFLAKFRIVAFEERCKIAQQRLQEGFKTMNVPRCDKKAMVHWKPIRGLTQLEFNQLFLKW